MVTVLFMLRSAQYYSANPISSILFWGDVYRDPSKGPHEAVSSYLSLISSMKRAVADSTAARPRI